MRRLLLFAKRPRRGKVKTRLVPPLLPEQALELYRAFLEDQIGFLASFEDRAAVELRLDGAWTAALGALPAPPGMRLRVQGPGDLGARLLRAFEESRDLGATATVVMGADSPTLPARHVVSAFAELERGAEAVASPAADGGFVLLGMRCPRAALLHDVPWSGPEVMRVTALRASEAGIDLRLIESWYDVDDDAGLGRLTLDLKGHAATRAPATARCLRSLAPR